MKTHNTAPVLKIDSVPDMWSMGMPLGNGRVGAMAWRGEKSLNFTLDHCDAWDLSHSKDDIPYEKYSYAKLRELVDAGDFESIEAAKKAARKANGICSTKVYLGRFSLDIEFDEGQQFFLDMQQALFSTDFENCKCSAFVARQADVLAVSPGSKANVKYIPFYESSPGLAALGNPKVELSCRCDLQVAIQHIQFDRYFALCWNDRASEIFISVAFARSKDEAVKQALDNHPLRQKQSFAMLLAGHKKLWGEFWDKSAVSLPEKELETLWYHGLYMMNSSARKGCTPPGLQGLWAMDKRTPPWNGDYHTDMNVQEYFWSACSANHLDLLDCWIDYTLKYLPKVKGLTKRIFGTDGSFYFCAYLPEYTRIGGGGWSVVNFAWSNTGWLTHLVWLRWRYSMDKRWLETTGYPLIRAAFEFYSENLELEPDGKYHIPLSDSPEYEEGTRNAWCKDPNVDIALIRKCCDWIVETEAALGIDEYSSRAREIYEKLVTYHLLEFESDIYYVKNNTAAGPYVLGLWKDKLLDQPHRHPSHLMAIHPAMDITVDDGVEANKIIETSLKHYMTLGQFCWAGHTYAQMISFAAVVGKGEMAHNFLRHYSNNWILPNKLHFNREMGSGNTHFQLNSWDECDANAPFTVNESCSITCGINDMLVQGWGNKIRIFPAVPRSWKYLSFDNLRTEGAFEVSAVMKNSKVTEVKIRATVNGLCRLQSPFAAGKFLVDGEMPEKDGDLLIWNMTAGQEITLTLSEKAR